MHKIKVDMWSHCYEGWEHYDYFESVEAAEKYIKTSGYDPRYFRIDT